MLRVWGRTNSVNVQKVLWALEEVAVPFERQDAGGPFGVVGTPDYERLNPNRLIPVIEDAGVVLWESNAIVRYLTARYGQRGLWLDDPAERALADRWMDWQQTTLQPDLGPVFLATVRTPPEKRDMAALLATAERLADKVALLDRHLARQRFVAGDALTMGDIPIGAAMWRWANLPVIERPAMPNLDAWLQRLQERPGFVRHVAVPLT